ncbi:hypothetical protein [Deinococcus sp. UR1]|uniref:hypothetical protein n=1 Tax=Deinococcus sp. UR1 TaxID=1704277 RepID=UPI0006DC1078|nr:hypothetical protein [Deinococcus sp. UR1]PIG98027.1 hypothetical protein AMD26_011050 [Deinococcus sp. UR1]
MNPDYLPNTFPAPKWARVVQAVTWAEYGLNEEGRITEKSVRGPVIVWGRTSGEGEDLPRLEAPTPSPLELETARLNMRPHFLAFVRAAHGKVRHSVRWKTRRGRVLSTLTRFLMGFAAFKVSEWPLVGRAYAKRWAKYAAQSEKMTRRSELPDIFQF